MKNKKSAAAIDDMVFFGIGVLVVFLIVAIIPPLLGKGSAQASELLTASRDFDGDGVMDYYDKCPCDAGEDIYDGCLATGIKTDKEICLKRIKEKKYF